MSNKEKLVKVKGDVKFEKNIVLSVINLATKEIAGVSSLVLNYGSCLSRLFNKNLYEGVKITYQNSVPSVDVYINVYYGFNVSEIAYRVQENIKNSIASMIDMNIDTINVHVLGADFSHEEDF